MSRRIDEPPSATADLMRREGAKGARKLESAAMNLGRVWGGPAHQSAVQDLLRAAKDYYEANRTASDPPIDGPVECP